MDLVLRIFNAPTMDDLHTLLCKEIIAAPAEQLDVISQVDVAIHNVVAVADSMVWDFDLKNVWLTKSRWTMMVRQYLDEDEVRRWLNQAVNGVGAKGRGQAVLRTKVVKPRGGEATGHTNKVSRKWGSCMLSLSYRARPQPTITLHSRTSYLGYLSALDFNIAHVLARYIAEELGIPVEHFKFVWMTESMQWHGFKSLPWAICNKDAELRKEYRRLLLTKLEKLDREGGRTWRSEYELAITPAMNVTRHWVNYVRREDQKGNSYGETNYNTYRRVRRRWHTEVFGFARAKEFEGWSYREDGSEREFFRAYPPLPTVMTSTLDLSPIKLVFGGSHVEEVEDESLAIDVCFACGEVEDYG